MAHRGKNFVADEERQLCLSFLHVSQDPIVGNGQKKIAFWERIASHFNEHLPRGCNEKRSPASLETKWSTISCEVSRFTAAHENVLALDEFGKSEEDILTSSFELYQAKHPKGKSFVFVSCWQVLKDIPKWQDLGAMATKVTKKQPLKKRGRPMADISNSQDADQETFPPLVSSASVDSQAGSPRPMGNRAAKDLLRKQKLQETVLVNQARASMEMANAIVQKVQLLKEQSLAALFSMKEDDIFVERREFFRLKREQELSRFKHSLLPSATPEVGCLPVPTQNIDGQQNLGSAILNVQIATSSDEDEDAEPMAHAQPNVVLQAWAEPIVIED